MLSYVTSFDKPVSLTSNERASSDKENNNKADSGIESSHGSVLRHLKQQPLYG